MTEVVFETAKSGALTARVDSNYLHSRYDPSREAEKFLKDRDLNGVAVCILFFPGLHYLAKCIKSAYPNILLINIHSNSSFVKINEYKADSRELHWMPSDSMSLGDFLAKNIRDCEGTLSELLIWQPSLVVYEESANRLLPIVQNFLKTAHANFLTAAYFGKKWLANSLMNYRMFETTSQITIPPCPVFLAASGPGLAMVLPIIKKFRDRFSLWALPSSIRALANAAICPDAIVTSDAGYWAGTHLSMIPEEWLRKGQTVIFCPFRAMLRPLFGKAIQIVFHESGSEFDQLIKSYLLYPLDFIPERGTVAATAMELLQLYGVKELFIAGLDFSNLDLESHIRPHTFQERVFTSANRVTPAYHQLFMPISQSRVSQDSSEWKILPNLEIYSTWFAQQKFRNYMEIFDYNPSQVEKNFPEINLYSLNERLEKIHVQSTTCITISNVSTKTNSPMERSSQILSWLEKIEYSIINISSNSDLPYSSFLELIAPFPFREWRRALSSNDPMLIIETKDRLIDISKSWLRNLIKNMESEISCHE